MNWKRKKQKPVLHLVHDDTDIAFCGVGDTRRLDSDSDAPLPDVRVCLACATILQIKFNELGRRFNDAAGRLSAIQQATNSAPDEWIDNVLKSIDQTERMQD